MALRSAPEAAMTVLAALGLLGAVALASTSEAARGNMLACVTKKGITNSVMRAGSLRASARCANIFWARSTATRHQAAYDRRREAGWGCPSTTTRARAAHITSTSTTLTGGRPASSACTGEPRPDPAVVELANPLSRTKRRMRLTLSGEQQTAWWCTAKVSYAKPRRSSKPQRLTLTSVQWKPWQRARRCGHE